MTLQDAMWRNESDRMEKAKESARAARDRGEHISAHSIMLSAYITVLGGKPVGQHHPPKLYILALYHALCMLRQEDKLNHNQLDVLIQFLIRIRKKFPHFPFRPNLIRLAELELLSLSLSSNSLPHQRALAHITRAEVEQVIYGRRTHDLSFNLDRALSLDLLIRMEADQPQGLRQLVRVYRKAGELYIAIGHPHTGKALLKKALGLAHQADAPDQVDKIWALIGSL